MENTEKIFITPKQAESVLKEGNIIHGIIQSKAMHQLLFGLEFDRENIIAILEEHKDTIEIAGDNAKAYKHGISVTRGDIPLFIETDMDKLEKLEKELTKNQNI